MPPSAPPTKRLLPLTARVSARPVLCSGLMVVGPSDDQLPPCVGRLGAAWLGDAWTGALAGARPAAARAAWWIAWEGTATGLEAEGVAACTWSGAMESRRALSATAATGIRLKITVPLRGIKGPPKRGALRLVARQLSA